MTTETIDKLYLELSQVTRAKTRRDIENAEWIAKARQLLKMIHNYNNTRLFEQWSDRDKLEYYSIEAHNLLATTPQE